MSRTHFSRRSRRGVILLIVLSMLALFSIIALTFVLYAQTHNDLARTGRQTEDLIQPDVEPERLWQFFLSQLIYPVDPSIGSASKLNGQSLMENLLGSGRAYTYPDNNNAFLAAIRANGDILMGSFAGGPRPTNYRAVVQSPEQAASNPYDVQNAGGWTKRNDSIWMDLGFGTFRTKDGRMLKALFAPLIRDLDSMVNINYQGGPGSGISLPHIFSKDPTQTEWTNLLYGTTMPYTAGRIPPGGAPLSYSGTNLTSAFNTYGPSATLTSTTTVAAGTTVTIPVTTNYYTTYPVPMLVGHPPGAIWNIRTGTQLLIEPGTPNQEVVTVQYVESVTQQSGSFTATFTKAHTNPWSFIVPAIRHFYSPPGWDPSIVHAPGVWFSSNTTLPPKPGSGTLPVTVTVDAPGAAVSSMSPNPTLYGTASGLPWQINAGMQIVIEPGTVSEVVADVIATRASPPQFDLNYTLRNNTNQGNYLPPTGTWFCTFRHTTCLSSPTAITAGASPAPIRLPATYALRNAGAPWVSGTLNAVPGGLTWRLSPGLKLILEPGSANEETITIASVDITTATIMPTTPCGRSHPSGFLFMVDPGVTVLQTQTINGVYTDGDAPFPTFAPTLRLDPRVSMALTPPRFGAWNLEPIFRHRDTNSPMLTSELQRVCPTNFTDKMVRQLVSTHSYDRGGVSTTPGINLNRTFTPYPAPNYRQTGTITSTSIDLNAASSLFPLPAGIVTNLDQFTHAQAERQLLASQIFTALRNATSSGITPVGANRAATDVTVVKNLRRLAQVAINCVSYIDEGDIMTPYNWVQDVWPGDTPEYIFGTELPRILMGEVFLEYRNAKVNLWVKYINTFSYDPTVRDKGDGILWESALSSAGVAPYRMRVVSQANSANFRAEDNVLGEPSFPTVAGFDWTPTFTNNALPDVNIPPSTPQTFYTVGPYDWREAAASYSNGQDYSNDTNRIRQKTPGFSVVQGAYPNTNVAVFLQRLACPNLPFKNAPGAVDHNPYITVDYMENIPIFNNTGTNNVFKTAGGAPITSNQTIDNTKHTYVGGSAGANHVPRFWHGATELSVGNTTKQRSTTKGQPYSSSRVVKTHSDIPEKLGPPYTQGPVDPLSGLAGSGGNNMFNHANNPNVFSRICDWVVHLDRPLFNTAELLQVSWYKPHELTQQVVTWSAGVDTKFQHRNPWDNPSGTFGIGLNVPQFLQTVITPNLSMSNNTPGLSMYSATLPDGRVPARLNVNNIWDIETWRALCDSPVPANKFNPGDIDALFSLMLASRSPELPWDVNTKTYVYTSGQTPQPFCWIGDIKPGGAASTAQDSFLRPGAPPNAYLLQVPSASNAHPYVQYDLLARILPNLTTRSNVFAVWLTVGFFEVDPATGAIGAEVGRSEGQNIRRRMFGVIDRSSVTFEPAPMLPQGVTVSLTSAGLNLYSMPFAGAPPMLLKSSSAAAIGTTAIALPEVETGQIRARAGTTMAPPIDVLCGMNTHEGLPWTIHGPIAHPVTGAVLLPGTKLLLDVGAAQEVVTVTGVNPATKTFTIAATGQNHNAGFAISNQGSPGSQPNFDHRANPAVVRHWSVID